MTTLAELTTPRSEDALADALLAALAAENLPVTDWNVGGVARTLVRVDAASLHALDATVAAVAKGGLLSLAGGPWLTLLAADVYGVERTAARFARHVVRLTDSAGAGPYTVTPGQLYFATAAGLRFQNAAGGTLDQGGTLDLEVVAESPGATYNASVGQIAFMLTPLAGVTCTNPDLGTGSSLVETGTDEEPDTSLRQRCLDRLQTGDAGATAAAYRTWAREASAEVTSADVRESTSSLQVDVRLSGAAGAVPESVVGAVQAFIDARRPVGVEVVCESVVNVPVDVTATLRVRAAAREAAAAQLGGLLSAFLLGEGAGATIYRSGIVEQLMAPEGVKSAELAAPAADVALAPNEVAVLGTVSITWVEL